MEEFYIKKVRSKAELEKALEIRKQVFIKEQGVPFAEEMDGLDESCIHYLGYFRKTPVATIRFRPYNDYLKMERAATLKEHRGKGYMSKLVGHLMLEGPRLFPELLLFAHSQMGALSFYKKLGWIQVGPIFEEAGIEHQVILFPPKHKEEIKQLKCLKNPEVPEYVTKVLWESLKE